MSCMAVCYSIQVMIWNPCYSIFWMSSCLTSQQIRSLCLRSVIVWLHLHTDFAYAESEDHRIWWALIQDKGWRVWCHHKCITCLLCAILAVLVKHLIWASILRYYARCPQYSMHWHALSPCRELKWRQSHILTCKCMILKKNMKYLSFWTFDEMLQATGRMQFFWIWRALTFRTSRSRVQNWVATRCARKWSSFPLKPKTYDPEEVGRVCV